MEHHTKLLTSLALGLITANAVAQNPEDPPPWWGVQDNVTVSLSWTFDTAFPNGQPDPVPSFAVTPAWYNNPSPWTASNNVTWIANLGGQQGVCGLIGNGTATLDLFVDNQSAIAVAYNPELHQRTKHIERRHYFVRERWSRPRRSVCPT